MEKKFTECAAEQCMDENVIASEAGRLCAQQVSLLNNEFEIEKADCTTQYSPCQECIVNPTVALSRPKRYSSNVTSSSINLDYVILQ